jgi:hypothetical protein
MIALMQQNKYQVEKGLMALADDPVVVTGLGDDGTKISYTFIFDYKTKSVHVVGTPEPFNRTGEELLETYLSIVTPIVNELYLVEFQLAGLIYLKEESGMGCGYLRSTYGQRIKGSKVIETGP